MKKYRKREARNTADRHRVQQVQQEHVETRIESPALERRLKEKAKKALGTMVHVPAVVVYPLPSPYDLRELRGHLAFLSGPSDGSGHLRSVAGDGSTCSKLASYSVHVVSAYAEVIRESGWALCAHSEHSLSVAQ